MHLIGRIFSKSEFSWTVQTDIEFRAKIKILPVYASDQNWFQSSNQTKKGNPILSSLLSLSLFEPQFQPEHFFK